MKEKGHCIAIIYVVENFRPKNNEKYFLVCLTSTFTALHIVFIWLRNFIREKQKGMREKERKLLLIHYSIILIHEGI